MDFPKPNAANAPDGFGTTNQPDREVLKTRFRLTTLSSSLKNLGIAFLDRLCHNQHIDRSGDMGSETSGFDFMFGNISNFVSYSLNPDLSTELMRR
jgi:hypothetical protein